MRLLNNWFRKKSAEKRFLKGKEAKNAERCFPVRITARF
jgi:predicted nucleotide-binding protein (sugar kinase/HSP70/actin superfamily)